MTAYVSRHERGDSFDADALRRDTDRAAGIRGITSMRHAWALSVATLLYGCAATPPAPVAGPVTEDVVTVAPQGSDVTCSIERPTGTKIAERQCMSRAEADLIREASQEWMRSGGSHGSPIYVRDPADPRDAGRHEDP